VCPAHPAAGVDEHRRSSRATSAVEAGSHERFADPSPLRGRADRQHAEAGLAIFEALNSIQPRYKPYRQALPVEPGALPDAATAAAAHAVLVKLMPDQAKELDAAYQADLAKLPDGPGKAAFFLRFGFTFDTWEVLADALARTVVRPLELPVGVVTALVGVPLFALLLRRTLA